MSSEAAVTAKRVGVRFDKVPRGVQSQLDHFVFALMKKKAQARARDTHPGAERRLAPRVEIGPAEKLYVEHLPDRPLGALASRAAAGQDQGPRFKVVDISTTGLALLCDEPGRFKPRQKVRLRLVGEDLTGSGAVALEVPAVVIHARR
jgi:c-di-GMP-binding flagellar brake protein YcgR